MGCLDFEAAWLALDLFGYPERKFLLKMNTTSLATPAVSQPRTGRPWITQWDVWVFFVPLLAMAPMLLFQWQNLMSRPERQFFPLVVLIALYFALRSILQTNKLSTGTLLPVWRARAAMVAFVLAVVTYATSVWLFSPWLAHLAAIVLFFGWALGRCVEARWPSVLAWTGLLAVTLPLPLSYDTQFIAWLQSSSSWACSMALDALGIPHLRTANVIEVRGRQLFVEEACSGIGSMYALLAAAALLVLVNGRSFVVAALTLASVPIWAMLGNFTRLLAIALAQHVYDRDLTHGMDHELLGLLTFALAACGLWMTEWLVSHILQPIPPTSPEFGFLFKTVNAGLTWPDDDPFANMIDTEGESAAERADREAVEAAVSAAREAAIVRVRPWELKPMRVLARTATAGALICGVAPAILVARGNADAIFSFNLPHFSETEIEKFPGAEAMPEKLGGGERGEWARAGFQTQHRSTASFFGEFSRMWEYRRGTERFVLSLDLPFRGDHPLQVCYSNSGWKTEAKAAATGPDSLEWPWMEIVMSNDFESRGFVCYSLLTEDGRPLVRGSGVDPFGIAQRVTIVDRIRENVEHNSTTFQPVTYQIQILCESGSTLTEDEKQDIRDCFLEARNIIRDQVSSMANAQVKR